MKTFIFHQKIISVTCVSFISKDLKMIVLPKGNDWECGCAGILMYGITVTQSWRLSRFLASRNSQSMGLTCICLNSWDPTMDTRPLHCDSVWKLFLSAVLWRLQNESSLQLKKTWNMAKQMWQPAMWITLFTKNELHTSNFR